MKFARTTLLGLTIILVMAAAAPPVLGQAVKVRWDIVSLTLVPRLIFSPLPSTQAVTHLHPPTTAPTSRSRVRGHSLRRQAGMERRVPHRRRDVANIRFYGHADR